MRVYENAEEKRFRGETKIQGVKRIEADKKVRSILYFALVAEGKILFSQKQLTVKVLSVCFKEFFNLLDAAFVKHFTAASLTIQ